MNAKSVQDPRGPNARWLMPYLTVVDAAKSIQFYQDAFGFTLLDKNEENGKINHAEMTYHGKMIVMFCNENAFGMQKKAPITLGIEMPSSLYLYVDDVDATAKKVKAAGGTVQMEPNDAFWGDRFAAVTDVDGYAWGLGRHTGVHSHGHSC
jgi:uncharacterized glyoxalase superfamily protein PhnB